MATGTTVRSALEKISRNHLECSICQKKYRQPKVLDCQHSFCEQCLVRYSSTQPERTGVIPCPVCRRLTQLPETGVQGLKTNFFITGLVEDFALHGKVENTGETKLICETCDEGSEATYCCLDCAKNICSKCNKMHLQFAELLSHSIHSLKEIRQGKVSLQSQYHKNQPKCHIHEGEVTRFFCMTCEKLICQGCTVIDHCKPEHTYVDSSAAAATCKQLVNELCAPLEGTLMELTKSLPTISTVKRELDTAYERTMKEVRKTAADFRTHVTAQENDTIDEIRRLYRDRIGKLDDCEKRMGIMTEGMQYSLETAKDVTSTASDIDFLSLYSTIRKDLTFLTSQNSPAVDETLAFLKFKRNKKTVDTVLGELQLKEGKWKKLREFGKKGGSPEEIKWVRGITGLELAFLKVKRSLGTGKWELLREFGKRGNGPGDFGWACSIAGLKQDEIAVSDWWNNRVVICSIKESQNNAIPIQAHPSGVAAIRTHDRLVVVCEDKTDVKLFNKNRSLAFEFPTVPRSEVGKTAVGLCSVAVKKNGTIVVGDTRRKVLTEHSPTNGSLIRTIPVERAPRYIAVDCSGRVVMSDWKHEVDVTDGSSTTLFTITPTIEGKQVRYCNGVCCDRSGIYIAMHNGEGTGHVHHYDSMGNYLCCVAKGLYMPQGITFIADGQHLVVADCYSVKVYHLV